MPEPATTSHGLLERPLTALDTIFTRRSVRAYTSQRIDESTVRALLDAAVQAPTALHAEPWVFAVVQDRETLKRISERAKGSWAREAAHYRELHPAADPALAAENLMLAAAVERGRHDPQIVCWK